VVRGESGSRGGSQGEDVEEEKVAKVVEMFKKEAA